MAVTVCISVFPWSVFSLYSAQSQDTEPFHESMYNWLVGLPLDRQLLGTALACVCVCVCPWNVIHPWTLQDHRDTIRWECRAWNLTLIRMCMCARVFFDNEVEMFYQLLRWKGEGPASNVQLCLKRRREWFTVHRKRRWALCFSERYLEREKGSDYFLEVGKRYVISLRE